MSGEEEVKNQYYSKRSIEENILEAAIIECVRYAHDSLRFPPAVTALENIVSSLTQVKKQGTFEKRVTEIKAKYELHLRIADRLHYGFERRRESSPVLMRMSKEIFQLCLTTIEEIGLGVSMGAQEVDLTRL